MAIKCINVAQKSLSEINIKKSVKFLNLNIFCLSIITIITHVVILYFISISKIQKSVWYNLLLLREFPHLGFPQPKISFILFFYCSLSFASVSLKLCLSNPSLKLSLLFFYSCRLVASSSMNWIIFLFPLFLHHHIIYKFYHSSSL